ncbi:MAG: enoyl-CoA hydratase/isomerase family protein [Spirochaetia bacterium]
MSYIQFEEKNGIGIVQFDRPEAMNALSSEGIREALRFFEGLGDPELTAILLTGSGKAFISGADVREIAVMEPREASRFSDLGNRLMSAIEACPVPVIAAVNGYAIGGGLEVALATDFIYASANAKMGLPEVTLGIMPGFGGVRRLCARIGTARAKELVYTGRLVTAQEALDLGIVNRVVLSGELMVQSMQTAALIGEAGPRAIRAAKRHANACMLVEAAQGAAKEAESFGGLFGDDESREGLLAFLEKRKPAWAKEGGQT